MWVGDSVNGWATDQRMVVIRCRKELEMSARLTLALSLLLVACAPLATPEPKPPTLAPAATEPAMATSVPTPTLDPRATVIVWPTPEPTADAVATLVANGPTSRVGAYDSPDGQWRAEIVRYDCTQISEGDAVAYEQLKLIRLADGVERVVVDQTQNCGGLGAFGLSGLFWSPNSWYFYFTTDREGFPDGGLICYWERSLFRVEAATASIEQLPPGRLSPDGEHMAVLLQRELVLWSVNSGEVARLPVPKSEGVVGGAIWSADGGSLIYLHTQSDCIPYGKTTIVSMAWPSLEQTVLLESDTLTFRAIAWHAPDEIELVTEEGHRWHFDLSTRELKPSANE